MKVTSPILPMALLSILVGCGGGTPDSATNGASTPTVSNPSDGDANTTPSATVRALATIQSNGSTVADIIYFGSAEVYVYIPSVDLYAGYVKLSDGEYVGSVVLYWSGTNCTGTPFASSFIGEVGKTVIYDSVSAAYWRVTSLYPVGSSVAFQSYSSGETCNNSSATITTTYGMAQLTQTTRPYDFSAIAPLSVKFQ